MFRSALLSLATLGPLAVLSHQSLVEVTPQTSGTTNRLQAISAVSDHVAWASGVGGTYVLTTDGGQTWRPGVVPGAERLEFRDVEAVSDREAYLLAAGTGEDSRIYRTDDGGKHWNMQFMNEDLKAFYDCFAFWDHQRGITMSDGVDGAFPVIRTTDGEHWKRIGGALPVAHSGEGAFAASGTCVATQGRGNAWIAAGGGGTARILATADGGDSWTAYDTPIVRGPSGAGGVSVAFRDRLHGILGGGDLAITEAFTDNVARSGDGGKTWRLASHPTFTGAIYGLAYVPRMEKTVVATGPRGASWTSDEGSHWFALDTVTDYWAVGFSSPDAGWLVGTGGRIAKVRFRNGG
ncbi:MAG: WD40/YVTN/BNR-like repeat-containing protein [Gemmatimonadales bacterium]